MQELIDSQRRIVADLQAKAVTSDPRVTRDGVQTLAVAIDKLATLEGLRCTCGPGEACSDCPR